MKALSSPDERVFRLLTKMADFVGFREVCSIGHDQTYFVSSWFRASNVGSRSCFDGDLGGR